MELLSPTDAAPAAVEPARSFTNPRLSATLSDDYEALRNDVAQAKELASEYQGQLAGKSNELGALKILFEKTQKDLGHLQTSILELREERHKLANEVMRGTAMELRCKDLTAERDALQGQLQALQKGLASAAGEVERCAQERESQIAWFTVQLQMLNQQQVQARGLLGASTVEKVSDPDGRHVLANLAQLLERLMGAPAPAASDPAPPKRVAAESEADETINISYVPTAPQVSRQRHHR